MKPYFVLLTDLGLSDPYAGQMNGMLHRLAPVIPILDFSHSVPRHDVRTGAFFLAAGLPYFGPGAVFLIVVDPGVGTDRALLCLHAQDRLCIAPNNGILTLAAQNFSWDGLLRIDSAAVRAGLDLPPLSSTFHGRDIAAPLGARLALGESLAAFGRPADMADMLSPPWSAAERTETGIKTTVLHVDDFGNVVLNTPVKTWVDFFTKHCPCLPQFGNMPTPFCVSYADIAPESAGLIAGSQGYLELACNRASAAKFLGVKPGHTLHLHLAPGA